MLGIFTQAVCSRPLGALRHCAPRSMPVAAAPPSAALNEHLHFLSSLPAEYITEFCKAALALLQQKAQGKMFSNAAPHVHTWLPGLPVLVAMAHRFVFSHHTGGQATWYRAGGGGAGCAGALLCAAASRFHTHASRAGAPPG